MIELRLCVYCDEPVLEGERVEERYVVVQQTPLSRETKEVMCDVRLIHFECAARGTLGSVGHQLRKCSCWGGTEDDPPHMTKRQAAQAALQLAHSLANHFVRRAEDE